MSFLYLFPLDPANHFCVRSNKPAVFCNYYCISSLILPSEIRKIWNQSIKLFLNLLNFTFIDYGLILQLKRFILQILSFAYWGASGTNFEKLVSSQLAGFVQAFTRQYISPSVHMQASSFVDESSYHFLFKNDPISGVFFFFLAAASAIHCNTGLWIHLLLDFYLHQ